MSLKTTLGALGDQVRRLSGRTNKMTLDAMTQALSNVSLGADVNGADAAITDVISGKKFVGANGVLETGSMINRGAVLQKLDTSTKSYTIPAGYHNGSGKVQIETQTKSVAPSASAQTVYPDAGKVLSAVTVAASAGRDVFGGAATFSGKNVVIDTGVQLSENDVFYILYYDTILSPAVYAFWGAVKSPELTMVVNITTGGTMSKSTDISFSGTTVTVGGAANSAASSKPYYWWLIKA